MIDNYPIGVDISYAKITKPLTFSLLISDDMMNNFLKKTGNKKTQQFYTRYIDTLIASITANNKVIDKLSVLWKDYTELSTEMNELHNIIIMYNTYVNRNSVFWSNYNISKNSKGNYYKSYSRNGIKNL